MQSVEDEEGAYSLVEVVQHDEIHCQGRICPDLVQGHSPIVDVVIHGRDSAAWQMKTVREGREVRGIPIVVRTFNT